MIFQDANLLPWRNLWQNIQFPFEIKKLDSKPYEARIQGLLDEVGLAGFEKKMPRELSGGMQQRASIVRCLSYDPDVILMDEPFGALDAFTRDEMNLLIQKIWMETGKTIIFVTHNVTEAIFLADRVVVLTPRPGRLAHVFPIDLPRPRTIDMTFSPAFIKMILEIKETIDEASRATRRRWRTCCIWARPRSRSSIEHWARASGDRQMASELRETIPTFNQADAEGERRGAASPTGRR